MHIILWLASQKCCLCVCACELCKNILKLRRRRLQQNPLPFPQKTHFIFAALSSSDFALCSGSRFLSAFAILFAIHVCTHVRSPYSQKKEPHPPTHFPPKVGISFFELATHLAAFSFPLAFFAFDSRSCQIFSFPVFIIFYDLFWFFYLLR